MATVLRRELKGSSPPVRALASSPLHSSVGYLEPSPMGNPPPGRRYRGGIIDSTTQPVKVGELDLDATV